MRVPSEANAPIADAEPKLSRSNAVELKNVAYTFCRKALDSFSYASTYRAVKTRQIIDCLTCPFDFFHVRVGSYFNPSRCIASWCGIPLPPLAANQSRACCTACCSSNVSSSSSIGAWRRAASTGSTSVSSKLTSAESCACGRRSISAWAIWCVSVKVLILILASEGRDIISICAD